jgi:hypothetical protein
MHLLQVHSPAITLHSCPAPTPSLLTPTLLALCTVPCLPASPADWVLPRLCSDPHQDTQAAPCHAASDGLLHVPVCALLCGSTHGTCTPLRLPGHGSDHAHILRVGACLY